ncbi:hypothetical protein HanRHA438_Chr16g0756331 [Helianthus annuus]|uniref:Uncharacterized protein n=1 Tax=Helianthus annuus TaxID=4232 RepID=A0A251SIL0_HELAN|nr:hypothetical protein HanXRQr2_Chr16g0744551 [Helianthus annuus]KAJ0437862.1 hypothetical protein HanHA300_Chr16g0607131 [Helianthus annuus]KAJ0442431.1 hypothetical protein HanIR_Chr16g0809191 [Helianthus annuus]KAJ0460187.1 hypothetical protein HanHA89_Chr16g0657731 [Helianthus annuus]KAJ0640626.1 hypothetical protein HanLR1_Chr16g0617721 [Helianthus annuus]
MTSNNHGRWCFPATRHPPPPLYHFIHNSTGVREISGVISDEERSSRRERERNSRERKWRVGVGGVRISRRNRRGC